MLIKQRLIWLFHANHAYLERADPHSSIQPNPYLCCSAKNRKKRKRLGWSTLQVRDQPCPSSLIPSTPSLLPLSASQTSSCAYSTPSLRRAPGRIWPP